MAAYLVGLLLVRVAVSPAPAQQTAAMPDLRREDEAVVRAAFDRAGIRVDRAVRKGAEPDFAGAGDEVDFAVYVSDAHPSAGRRQHDDLPSPRAAQRVQRVQCGSTGSPQAFSRSSVSACDCRRV